MVVLSLSRRIRWTRRWLLSLKIWREQGKNDDCSSDRISNIIVQISIEFNWYPIRSSTYLYEAMNVHARRSVILLIHSLTKARARERGRGKKWRLCSWFAFEWHRRKKTKRKEKMKKERWRHANVLPLLLFLSFDVNCLQMRWSSV